MTSETLFYIIVGIIAVKYFFDLFIDYKNACHFKDPIPKELSDIYNPEDYEKSQSYKLTNYRFSKLTGLFSFIVMLLFLFLNGFYYVDDFARSITSNPILVTLLFFGIIFLGNDIISTPFSYYKTFVIEEKFGFNKSTLKTFITDKLKSWLLLIVLGGGILALVTYVYQLMQEQFWLYAWGIVTLFSVFMNMFYSKIIVPLFNKQEPLEEGELKDEIEKYARKVGFKLKKIFVINGSKRSTKANAYFSGLGAQKQITLYDTLINDLSTEEIVAVLAHEVGHYKKKHIVSNLILSTLITGVTFYLFSLIVGNSLIAEALQVSESSFHIGLLVFGFLYSPISEITGILMNSISRKFEYQADAYAKNTFAAAPLISSLKKLSKNNLSNLTPAAIYVKIHYSHPTLLQRFKHLNP